MSGWKLVHGFTNILIGCLVYHFYHLEHTYQQAPYQDTNKEGYEFLKEKMPKNVDWSKLSEYEMSDMTIGSQELACVAGACEIQ